MSTARHLTGTRVIVAGAGLAGLTAARALERDGAEVSIIEARARVGGRVWTIRDGFGRQHAEAGADLIESNQSAVLELVRELGLETTKILGGGFAYYGPDRRGRLAIRARPATFGAAFALLDRHIREYRLDEQRWESAFVKRLARQSVAEWLAAEHVDPWLAERFRGFRGLFLADPEDLSLLALVDFLATTSMDDESHTSRVKKGNDRIATEMARRLRTPPELNTVLRRVRQDAASVTVTLDTPRGLVERRADFLVSAIPATTLRDVIFEPVLPVVQQQAIRGLRYGPATRVLLQFSRRFWRKSGERPRLFGSDQAFGATWDGNEQQPGPAGILSLLGGGGASDAIQQIIRDEGVDGLVTRLPWIDRTPRSSRPARVRASRTITWEHDPWAGGGYAYLHPSFEPEWRDALARAAGRVLFAGEHTSIRWQGYMNGAVESGQRAAAEVAALARHR